MLSLAPRTTLPAAAARSTIAWLALAAMVLTAASSAAAPREDGLQLLQQQYAEQQDTFRAELETLAQRLEQAGETAGAAEVRAIAEPPDRDGLHYTRLPRSKRPEIDRALPADEQTWRRQLRRFREEQADRLYEFSRTSLQRNQPSFAFRVVQEAARLNPDHQYVRRLLGYVQYENEWLTPYEAEMRRSKHVWDDRFGWVKQDDLKMYENGLRPVRDRWISAAQEAEIRRNFEYAWEVRTDHFLVKTNHSLERGVEIASKLEDYYRFFIATFPGLFNSRDQMQQLFNVSNPNVRPRVNDDPFEVHCYRSKEEYVARLSRQVPIIAITNGIYLQGNKVSYFFHDDESQDDATLYHEATHQILYESRRRPRPVADKAHFWVVEGFACYMESYKNENGVVSLGDPWFIRFDNARARLIGYRYYQPLERMASWGAEEFKAQPEIKANYSQSSGLVHFFLHADDGAYRDAFVEHIAGVYSAGNRAAPGLDRLTGVDYHELDKQYILYIKRQAEDLGLQADSFRPPDRPDE